MPVHIKVAGVWEQAISVHVKTGGVWEILTEANVKVGGTWHDALGGDVVTLSGSSGTPNVSSVITVFPTDATAGWRFRNDGSVERLVVSTWTDFNDSTEWVIPHAHAGSYWIRATLDADSAPSAGPALGSWHALTTTRTWTWTETDSGTFAGTLKIEIATDSGGSTIVATGYYRGSATSSL